MENEKLPIKFFAPREVDELKVEGAGSSEPPKWVLTGEELAKRSSDLLSSFAQFTDNVAEREKRNSAVPFVFIAKMNKNAVVMFDNIGLNGVAVDRRLFDNAHITDTAHCHIKCTRNRCS